MRDIMKLKKKPCEGFTLRKHILFAHVCVLWKKNSAFRSLKFLLQNKKKTNSCLEKKSSLPPSKIFHWFLAACYEYDYLVLSTELIIWLGSYLNCYLFAKESHLSLFISIFIKDMISALSLNYFPDDAFLISQSNNELYQYKHITAQT